MTRLIAATLWAFNIGMLGWHVSLPPLPELTPEAEWQVAATARKASWKATAKPKEGARTQSNAQITKNTSQEKTTHQASLKTPFPSMLFMESEGAIK